MSAGAPGPVAPDGSEERTYSDQLAFKARALAQTHPLTGLARRFVDRAVSIERSTQPLSEVGLWTSMALMNGYCLRRVEEDAAGLVLEGRADADVDLDDLDERAGRIAADLRDQRDHVHALVDAEAVIAALDRIIASEVERRLDHWRDSVDETHWAELGEYITFWVVKGYALRVAEAATGAVG